MLAAGTSGRFFKWRSHAIYKRFSAGGVLWSKVVFCCFIDDVCGETNAVTADVRAQNLFRVDILGPCMAKVESVLMSCSAIVLLSASQSASETVALLFPPSFGFVGRPPFVWLKKMGTHRALICRYERTKLHSKCWTTLLLAV